MQVALPCASVVLYWNSRAMKPGDVLTGASGKTVEVINTDAEGRLILGDGLWYAQQLGATHLVDVATLTGACVVGLGKVASGLFGRPDAWRAGGPADPQQSPAATAANVAFVVAHGAGARAAAGGGSYEAAFGAERAWQAAWLRERLALPSLSSS